MCRVQGLVSELCCVTSFSNQSCQPVCKWFDAQGERKRNMLESMLNSFHHGKSIVALSCGRFCLVFAFPTPGHTSMKPV